MRRNIFLIIACLVASFFTGVNGNLNAQWVSAYYAGWQQSYLPPSSIDYGAVTHIIHFALIPNSNGTLNDAGNGVTAASASALISAAHAKGVKVIICVGGWGTQGAFQSASSGGTRATFVKTSS